MKCKYRNCNEIVSGGRPDKEYCRLQCKRNEKKYRQRERKKLLKDEQKIDTI
jgi:hypothetical protein